LSSSSSFNQPLNRSAHPTQLFIIHASHAGRCHHSSSFHATPTCIYSFPGPWTCLQFATYFVTISTLLIRQPRRPLHLTVLYAYFLFVFLYTLLHFLAYAGAAALLELCPDRNPWNILRFAPFVCDSLRMFNRRSRYPAAAGTASQVPRK
jgi:hypothetical protein